MPQSIIYPGLIKPRRRPVTSGLVLDLPLYKLDGSPFTSLDSYGILCTVTGSIWSPEGRVFTDSTNLINLGNPAILNMAAPNAFTLKAWVKYLGTTTGGTQRIIDKESGANGYMLAVNNTSRTVVHRWNGGTLSASTDTVKDGAFSHVVRVFTGTETLFYLDGVLSQTWAEAITLADNTASVYLGNDAVGDRPFNGVIGEVRIYNRALSASEVQRNYLATKGSYR